MPHPVIGFLVVGLLLLCGRSSSEGGSESAERDSTSLFFVVGDIREGGGEGVRSMKSSLSVAGIVQGSEGARAAGVGSK